MSRWNDPQRDEHAAALKRRLAASRGVRSPDDSAPRLMPALIVVGLFGAALMLYAIA